MYSECRSTGAMENFSHLRHCGAQLRRVDLIIHLIPFQALDGVATIANARCATVVPLEILPLRLTDEVIWPNA